jgi:hypothetical protein
MADRDTPGIPLPGMFVQVIEHFVGKVNSNELLRHILHPVGIAFNRRDAAVEHA